MASRLFILSLCSITLVHGADVTGFNCTLGNSHGDTVDVHAAWNAGTCFAGISPDYTLYFTAPHGTETKVGKTAGTNFTLPDMEFWTNFTIKLRKTCLVSNTDYFTTIATGPGSPHKVSNVKTAPDSVSVNVTIEEADKMPKIVDQYELRYCVNGTKDCHSKFIFRNTESQLKVTLKDVISGLAPSTTYELNTTAIIAHEKYTYRSEAFTVHMKTTKTVAATTISTATEKHNTYTNESEEMMEAVCTPKAFIGPCANVSSIPYPDTKDPHCQGFYQCAPGNHEHYMCCSPGTMFDPFQTTCIHYDEQFCADLHAAQKHE